MEDSILFPEIRLYEINMKNSIAPSKISRSKRRWLRKKEKFRLYGKEAEKDSVVASPSKTGEPLSSSNAGVSLLSCMPPAKSVELSLPSCVPPAKYFESSSGLSPPTKGGSYSSSRFFKRKKLTSILDNQGSKFHLVRIL